MEQTSFDFHVDPIDLPVQGPHDPALAQHECEGCSNYCPVREEFCQECMPWNYPAPAPAEQ